MDIAIILAIILIFATAFMFSPLGLGGGVLYVPILLYLVGWDIHLSLLGSLILVLMVSLGSRMAHSKGGYAIMEIGKLGIAPALFGAIIGTIMSAYLIQYFGDLVIKMGASILLLWVIIRTMRQLVGENHGKEKDGLEPREIKGLILNKYMGLCLAGGVTSGALGIGGGMLFVTFHRSLFSWKPHYAAGTSYIIETWMIPVGIVAHLMIDGTGPELLETMGIWIFIMALSVFSISWVGARTAIKLVPQKLLTYPFLIAITASLARYCLDIWQQLH